MNEIAKLILAVSALLLCGELAAQTFKCTDANGRITYAGKQCSDLGLKDAGEVKDRLNVQPADQSPAAQSQSSSDSRRPPAPAPAPQAPSAEAPAPAAEASAETANPDRRCFTVKTAKGNVTRCNDNPE